MTALNTVGRYINQRIDLRLRLILRRLIMEKIIYSEIGSIEKAYADTLGYQINPQTLERVLMKDLKNSISVIFVHIPNAFSHVSRLTRSSYKLCVNKEDVHYILLMYPFLFTFVKDMIGALTTWRMSDKLVCHFSLHSIEN